MKIRTAEKRDLIVATAAQLFHEKGYAGASTDELVRRLGGSKATVYGYFPSKSALFSAVVRSVATSHLTKAIKDLAFATDLRLPVQASLAQFARGVLQVLACDERALNVTRMVIAEAGRSDIGKLFYESGPLEAKVALGQLLQKFMDRGELRQSDADVAASHLLALVAAEANGRFYERNPAAISPQEIQRMSECAVDCFLHGTGSRS